MNIQFGNLRGVCEECQEIGQFSLSILWCFDFREENAMNYSKDLEIANKLCEDFLLLLHDDFACLYTPCLMSILTKLTIVIVIMSFTTFYLLMIQCLQ